MTSFSGSRGPRRRGIVLDKKNEVGRDSRLPKPIGKEASGKRLVLGFDGGCSACGELARRIGETTSKLEVCSLYESRVVAWRKKALGQDAPLVPTLFEVGGPEEVRAWTGWRLGAALGRFLGPFDTWQVMQALGEAGEDPEDEEAPIEGGAVIGLTRGQFLRGVGGGGSDERAVYHRRARGAGQGPERGAGREDE